MKYKTIYLKKNFYCILAFIILSLSPVLSQTALDDGTIINDVMEDYFFAIGNKLKIKKISTLALNLKISVNGILLDGIVFQEKPHNYRLLLMSGNDTIQEKIFNGKDGVIHEGSSSRNMSEKEADELLLLSTIFPEQDYDNSKFTFELLGYVMVDSRRTYRVKISTENGFFKYNYYDIITSLLLKEEYQLTTKNGPVKQVVLLSDYREINGVKYPFEKVIKQGDDRIIMKVLSIQFNPKLQSNMFIVQ